MTLQAGESELDTVTVKLIDQGGIEIRSWETVTIRKDFLTPTSSWELVVPLREPQTALKFKEGEKIQIAINNKPQITGYVEKFTVKQSREGGSKWYISGRDILGPVVSSNADPKIQITESMTVLDFLSSVLSNFRTGEIWNNDALNIQISTGINAEAVKNKTAVNTQIAFAKPVSSDNQSVELEFETVQTNIVNAGNRPDLKTIKLKDLKPRDAEGAYDFIDRVLKRLGFKLWAISDGTGVIVDRPNFERKSEYKLIRSLTNTSDNNIIDGSLNVNIETQPVCIIGKGNSLDSDGYSSSLECLAINEFNGIDASGEPIQFVKDIIAKHKGILVLPLRQRLFEEWRTSSSSYPPVVMYLKDDESRNLAQLASAMRKKLSDLQKEYFVYEATVQGLSYQGKPFEINTLVSVKDEVALVDEEMWVLSKTFVKSRGEGSRTYMTLIRPFTLELSGE